MDNAHNYLVGCVIQKRLNSDQTLTYALQPFLSINDVYQSFGGYQSSVRGEMVMIWMCIMKLSGTLKSNICKCGFFKILFLSFTMFFFKMWNWMMKHITSYFLHLRKIDICNIFIIMYVKYMRNIISQINFSSIECKYS